MKSLTQEIRTVADRVMWFAAIRGDPSQGVLLQDEAVLARIFQDGRQRPLLPPAQQTIPLVIALDTRGGGALWS
jgi:hypothetical protein